MGKHITFKKNKRVITEQELQQRIKKANEDLEQKQKDWTQRQKDDITGSASELAFCLFMVATSHVYGFKNKRCMRIYEEIVRIQGEISEGRATWWDVRDEADKLGFVPANENGYLEEKP